MIYLVKSLFVYLHITSHPPVGIQNYSECSRHSILTTSAGDMDGTKQYRLLVITNNGSDLEKAVHRLQKGVCHNKDLLFNSQCNLTIGVK